MKRMILALLADAALAASSPAHAAVKTIVLVHGAFADGSGCKPVAFPNVCFWYKAVIDPSGAFDTAANRFLLPPICSARQRAQGVPCARRPPHRGRGQAD